jgi:lipopolysaccharide export system protein LptA
MDKATVWKDNGTYSSNLIEYDIKTSLVKAGSKTSDNSRVHVVLKPKSVEQKSSEKPVSAIISPK